jgi:hypothetical protein
MDSGLFKRAQVQEYIRAACIGLDKTKAPV